MSKNKRMVTIFRGNGPPLLSVKYDRNALCHCGSGLKQKKCCGNSTKYYNSKSRREPSNEK